MPVYTTAQWDGRIMREHPEWLAVDENGEFIDTQGVPAPHFYHTICLNSGYRTIFQGSASGYDRGDRRGKSGWNFYGYSVPGRLQV